MLNARPPRDPHNKKPPHYGRRIERLFPGPYVELYGRKLVPGWTVWGNEISARSIRDGGRRMSDRDDGAIVTEARASWQRAAFTGEQLRLMKFGPLSWIVPEIVPAEGVTLFCSRPKFGKSWLAYDLCIASTLDRFLLGEIKPAQGDVLYLALEDSKRRLQRRMTKLLPTFSGKWPDKLTITTEWRRLHEGGLDDIRAWHEDAKAKGGKPIMVVIDVLAKVRKPTGNKPVYEADYEALTGLHGLSHELGIAIVVIHHTRKMAADDLMETVSGSYGLTGAVDTVIVMANKGGGAVLDVRGRDVESDELAIQFSKDSCRWTILGSAAEVHQSDQRKAIIAALVDRGEPMRINELAAATGMKRNPLELLLGKMVKAELIKRAGSGRYAHKDYADPPKPTKPKPTKADDMHKSVRSVSPVSPAGQMRDGGQPTDGVQKSADICLSVRPIRKFTSKADVLGSVAECVKTRTDQTDGQIEAQAAEEAEKSDSENLSDLQTDQTDQTDGRMLTDVKAAHEELRLRGEATAADDLSIPEWLLRRDALRPCAQCGAGRPDDQPTVCLKDGDRLIWLHERGCHRFWLKEHRSSHEQR
jgi:AAA domain